MSLMEREGLSLRNAIEGYRWLRRGERSLCPVQYHPAPPRPCTYGPG